MSSDTLRAWSFRISRRAALVGPIDEHVAIEAASAQQRGVQNLGSVRRRHQDHANARIEAVELDEQLVQRLLALLVRDRTDAARLAQRVQLVDEDDARRLLLRLLEQVAHARRADADEHLDEVGAADREERHPRFAGDGARQQRLARARRSHQHDTLGKRGAQPTEASRRLQELDDLLQLLLGLVDARDVGEADMDVLLHVHLGLAAPDGHEAVAAA